VYQIYPRSFLDTTGSGVGDLDGVTARLGHLRWLGVDAIWLSPIHPSPGVDGGYDVADHLDVDPIFGGLPAFDRLLAAAHARGLRVLLDWVPNHTSAAHPWFVSSRADPAGPHGDWYWWADEPANNWRSAFGGPAWTLDPARGQYYLHLFTPAQPDLNWNRPACARRCSRACGSGSTAGSTGSARTSCT
jgi:alpha-glucosidase